MKTTFCDSKSGFPIQTEVAAGFRISSKFGIIVTKLEFSIDGWTLTVLHFALTVCMSSVYSLELLI